MNNAIKIPDEVWFAIRGREFYDAMVYTAHWMRKEAMEQALAGAKDCGCGNKIAYAIHNLHGGDGPKP